MATGEPIGGSLEYQGRRYRLLPQPHHAWAVIDRKRCVGFIELACPHIGDEGPRFAAKRLGEERAVVDGWTDDWRLAVEWLVDQELSSPSPRPRADRSPAARGTSPS